MSAIIKRENKTLSLLTSVMPTDDIREAALWRNKIKLLEQLVVQLQGALESLSETRTPDVRQGLDFYEEVSRFEMQLIKHALIFMDGHQGKAARLLNMNATTLNSKVRHYNLKRIVR